MAETRTIQLRKGQYFAGFSRPFFITDGMIEQNLQGLGATNVVFHRRDNETPPVDPKTDPEHTDDWEEWISADYHGEPKSVQQPKLWAWAVSRPDPVADAPQAEPDEPGATLAIKPGRNVWVLGRTDRDAPSAADAQQTAGAWLSRLFGEPTLPPGQDIEGGATRYSLGSARPLDVSASQTRPALPAGKQTWTWEADQPEPLALNAERPWYVLADFDWRGPTRRLEEWPRRAVNQWGIPTDDPQALDWLLLEARWIGEPTRRDSTWTGDVVPTLPQLGSGFGLIALLAFLFWARK